MIHYAVLYSRLLHLRLLRQKQTQKQRYHEHSCHRISIKYISYRTWKCAKKFPDVCVRPTPILNDSDTIIIVLSSNLHSFSILIPSYMIDPNIITVHPPSTACGSELKNAPSGGNNDARIRINAPIKIVKRLITCVIVTSPIF